MDIERIRAVILRLSIKEKIAFTGGRERTCANDGARIESMFLTDALNAFSLAPYNALALGCSFSDELCAKVGRNVSINSARRKSALAQFVNIGIMRDPMRFDSVNYFSEDGYLTAKLARAFMSNGVLPFGARAMLGQGANNVRTIDDRALNELYFRPFYAVKDKLRYIMVDSGTLNGERVACSRRYCDFLIKKTGAMLVSEPSDTPDPVNAAVSKVYNTDQSAEDRKAIEDAVTNGRVHDGAINRSIEPLIAAVAETHEFYKTPSYSRDDEPINDYLLKTSVLLKNDGLLPIDDCAIEGDTYLLSDGAKKEDKKVTCVLVDGMNFDERACEARVNDCAKTGKVVVAVCRVPVELDFAKNASAILFVPDPTDSGELLSLVKSKVAPLGRLPFSWAKRASDYMARKDTYLSKRGDFRIESIYGGYRYFNNYDGGVDYPFGFGLTYGEPRIVKSKVVAKEDGIHCECVIDSDRECDSVLQLYVSSNSCGAFGVKNVLAGIVRVHVNGATTVKTVIDNADIALYDCDNKRMFVASGKYDVSLGFSSTDIRETHSVKVRGDYKIKESVSLPTYERASGAFTPTAIEIEKLFSVKYVDKGAEEERIAIHEKDAAKLKKIALKGLKKKDAVYVEAYIDSLTESEANKLLSAKPLKAEKVKVKKEKIEKPKGRIAALLARKKQK